MFSNCNETRISGKIFPKYKISRKGTMVHVTLNGGYTKHFVLRGKQIDQRYQTTYHNNHRIDGPAILTYNDTLHIIEFVIRGKRHRIGRPAYFEFDNGHITMKKYYENNVLHRFREPAIVSPGLLEWYKYGYKIKPPDYLPSEYTMYRKYYNGRGVWYVL